MSAAPRPLTDLLLALFGPIVWSAHFFSLYLADAMLCTSAEAAAGAMMLLLGTSLTVIALVVLLAFVFWRCGASELDTNASWLATVASVLAILSMLAIAWTSLPLLMLPPCEVQSATSA